MDRVGVKTGGEREEGGSTGEDHGKRRGCGVWGSVGGVGCGEASVGVGCGEASGGVGCGEASGGWGVGTRRGDWGCGDASAAHLEIHRPKSIF